MVEECSDERGHLRVEISASANDADVGEFRLRLAREVVEGVGAKDFGTLMRMQHLDLRYMRPGKYRLPARRHDEVFPRQTGLFKQLPAQVVL